MRYGVLALYAAVLGVILVAANLGGTHEVFHLVTSVPGGDKLGHFVLMGVLAALVDLALRRRDVGRVPLGPAVVLALVTLEEVSQRWMSTRTFDLLDLAADVAGIVAFTALGRALAGWWAGRARRPRHP